ncbi:S8 family serine peptidase [Zeaxanthinibacter sp. PT1]|uniref:S8 family peptidase n=1 Tax=Zeaxanthinibacter TaxID=561554 RepID=UPI002349F38C|nr:S8 family serine peptidase [Zeaxanthinibacter sp. PT1]MDC6350666.1 S8 family serine peptidase [Zeaxanthinibacter sp. PT1]
MNPKTIKYASRLSSLSAALLLMVSCGGTSIVSTPVENIDNVPLKTAELTQAEKENWGHLDLIKDTIPGMSVDKAYREIIGNKKGETVIVAVLDAGVDLEHEDLDGVIWTNSDEKPGNGVDDDKNGYVDDVHGYNFLGESYNEQLEYTRILKNDLDDAATRALAQAKLDEEKQESLQNKSRYEQILQAVKEADKAVSAHLGKEDYTEDEVYDIETEEQALQQHKAVLLQMYNFKDSIPEVIEELKNGIAYFSERLEYHFNLDFDGRSVVGDDPYDITDTDYGNGNPMPRHEDETHGTHVAGIIAAERNNGQGANGVADNVKIMAIRAVPNGDEYDKDIALGIRYAVDNGAKIINASFGKSFSPNAEWVYDAIKYAAEKDVLIVHAAGNDGLDLDKPENPNYPNDQEGNTPEFADNVITVGALESKYGADMVATFSNYGKVNVDVFAPGGKVYSTLPGNEYDFMGGTSMAAPAVSGVAALVWSHYPKLSASEVKKIIMESGLTTKSSVLVAGDQSKAKSFDGISRSGKMVNAYNALIMADKVAKGKIKL